MTKMRQVFDGIPVRSALITDFKTLRPDDSLARAIELIRAGSQPDFPVTRNGEVVGILERNALMKARAQPGQNASVGQVMATGFQTAATSGMLQSAMARLQSCNCHILPVLSNQELAEWLNMENIGELMLIHAALQKNRVS